MARSVGGPPAWSTPFLFGAAYRSCRVTATNQTIVLAQLDDIASLPTLAYQTVEPSEAAVSN